MPETPLPVATETEYRRLHVLGLDELTGTVIGQVEASRREIELREPKGSARWDRDALARYHRCCTALAISLSSR